MTNEQVEYINKFTNYVSPCSGVWYSKKRQKWGSKFLQGTQVVNLGKFNTEKEAVDAYLNYSSKYYENILTKTEDR
jgi:hypothetical protein